MAGDAAESPRYVSFLLQGIAEGFRVRMDRSQVRLRSAKRNHRSVNQRPAVVDADIQWESQAGRLLGPLPYSLLPLCQVSLIGLVPKSQPGQWRLIMDLSFPNGHSINDGNAQDMTSIQYARLEDAVQMVRVLGRGTLLAKVDLKSTSRVVPVHRDDWSLLAIQWERQKYLDTALPFGLRSAPKLFSAVADAVAWRMWRRGIRYQLHYLDDYLLLGPPGTPVCRQALTTTLELCQFLGVPVAMEKVQGPSTTLVFLGIEIDTV